MQKALPPIVLLGLVLASACQGADPSDLFADGGDASTGGATGGATTGTTGAATGSGTTSTGGATTGTTTGGAESCNATSPSCAVGTTCRATGCGGKGTCVTIPGGDDDLGPVCGCDGYTYWNGRLAGAKGVAIRGSGACPSGAGGTAIPCGGLNAATCPANSYCNLQANNAGACVTAVQGTCWILPANCVTGEGLGPKRRRCAGGPGSACQAQCALIESSSSYYEDATCK